MCLLRTVLIIDGVMKCVNKNRQVNKHGSKLICALVKETSVHLTFKFLCRSFILIYNISRLHGLILIIKERL